MPLSSRKQPVPTVPLPMTSPGKMSAPYAQRSTISAKVQSISPTLPSLTWMPLTQHFMARL